MPRASTVKKSAVQIRPDSKGRVSLGKFAEGISSFIMSRQPDGKLILDPMVEIPAREKWLHQNPTALESVEKGLRQSAAGEVVSRGSFAKFTNEKDE